MMGMSYICGDCRIFHSKMQFGVENTLLHSITTDNGSEFTKFKTIERSLKTPIYFAHPYQSWDKPHIEYLNKLLRQFIPKSSTFEDLTDADLRRFQNLLNNRPRKNLNYKTPNEVIKNIILEKLH